MINRFFAVLTALSCFLTLSVSSAAINNYRWTYSAEKTDNLAAILSVLNTESGLQLTEADFKLVEEKTLATSQFKTYSQLAEGVAVSGAVLRTWSDRKTGALIQMEAALDDSSQQSLRQLILKRNNITAASLNQRLSQIDNMKYVKQIVLKHRDDRRVLDVQAHDEWSGYDLQRVIKVRAAHGTHTIVVSHVTKKVVSATYEEHPQVEIPAYVYPIYEEAEKQKGIMDREFVVLKNLNDTRRLVEKDPYESMRNRKYYEDMIDPVLGETEEGREQGFWTPRWLIATAKSLFESLPTTPNTLEGGLFLQGKFATINLHPDAVTKLQGLDFSPVPSGQLSIIWKLEDARYEVIPSTSFNGRALSGEYDALKRIARRMPNHDPVTYINDGFDEVQVYYAINRLMESLQQMGFNDPELSTRPFHAFLYDPDISMRDNAYYTNDTINFTTYSPDAQNFARDNSTIWHELGHGVMDRLMGDFLKLTDSGGLSEGMADFVAQLVIQDVTNGKAFRGSSDFRIINKTGFNLTNESHDDGEAYGGAMNDMMVAAITKMGRNGLLKFSDLTMETMRLTRNNPGLDANGWFEHMLYADELGHDGVREKGEMREFILTALRTRNFNLDRSPAASMTITSDVAELNDKGPGSRRSPISHALGEGQEATHTLQLSLKSSEGYPFKYPVTIEVGFNGGPLQGAVKWKGEENGPQKYTLNSEADVANITLAALPGCDFVNREDGSCSDFAYIKAINNGETHAAAKMRFYLRISKP